MNTEDTLRVLGRSTTNYDRIWHPQWEERDLVHNWRNYIPDEIKAIWLDLSEDARVIAWYMAQEQADSEEWE